MKIKKVKQQVANLRDKTDYVIHERKLKQELNHGLVFKKLHRIIKFNKNAWLKPCIDMSTDPRKKEAKTDFEKKFFKLINNAVFGTPRENVKKNIEILNLSQQKEEGTTQCQNQIITLQSVTENLLAIEMRKNEILLNKAVYLKLSILELSKILMYEFCYHYVKQKYGEKAKLFYRECQGPYIKYVGGGTGGFLWGS